MRTLREPRPERVDDPDQRELPLVLIVEDDPAVRRALEKILAPHYAIRIAPDGQAGVGAALSLRPDVVIADLGLRDVNGLHVCEAIKASLRTTPVLIVTASRERATRTECLSSGADDCLILPVDEPELLARVATLAKLCRNERALARALQELADKDAALTADLEAASRFQESLLCLQPRAAGFDLCVVYRPLHLVGGDVYDVAELAPGHVRIFVGDATGHGVQAAFRTILIKSEYDAIKGARCPVELMGELNRRIVAKYEHLGMSFTACCYDITRAPGARTAQVRYVNGAFPSSIHVAGGEAREIFGIGSMLGVRREVRFDVKDLQLGLGDALFVFTDGLFEARDGEKREYGYRRLRNALLAGRARGLHDAAEQVFTELESFIAPCSLTDDATLIGLAMTEGGAAERTHD